MATRYVGTVTAWFEDKGYGFISPRGGGKDVFIHISACPNREAPAIGTRLTYELSRDFRGRMRADCAAPEGVTHETPVGNEKGLLWVGVPLVLIVSVALLDLIPKICLGTMGAMSVLSFLTYGIDKLKAVSGGWRTSEDTLHLIDLCGGWPGGALAQIFFRHKVSKASFRGVYWTTVAVSIAALVAVSTAINMGFIPEPSWDDVQR